MISVTLTYYHHVANLSRVLAVLILQLQICHHTICHYMFSLYVRISHYRFTVLSLHVYDHDFL